MKKLLPWHLFLSSAFLSCTVVTLLAISAALGETATKPELNVKDIMNALLTPATNTIWRAPEQPTAQQWTDLKNAAITVIAAGNLLSLGGSAAGEAETAADEAWKNYNQQMIQAAREVITAVEAQDSDALFNAGNAALYPPCESCHQSYQQR